MPLSEAHDDVRAGPHGGRCDAQSKSGQGQMTDQLTALVAAACGSLDFSKRVVALSNERDDLNKRAPQIPRRAFERARRGIEEGEATYLADKA